MIVVDSSALCAVFFKEPERRAFLDVIDGNDRCVISAVNAHETAVVLRGKLGDAAVEEFWQWLSDNRIEVVPFDEPQARAASDAYGRYGKGIDSKASLNLSDCAAYALARTFGAPLLFKGNDFSATDIKNSYVTLPREGNPGSGRRVFLDASYRLRRFWPRPISRARFERALA